MSADLARGARCRHDAAPMPKPHLVVLALVTAMGGATGAILGLNYAPQVNMILHTDASVGLISSILGFVGALIASSIVEGLFGPPPPPPAVSTRARP